MAKHLLPRNIFFIDAIGAAISSLLLSLVLPYLVPFIGMPSIVLLWTCSDCVSVFHLFLSLF